MMDVAMHTPTVLLQPMAALQGPTTPPYGSAMATWNGSNHTTASFVPGPHYGAASPYYAPAAMPPQVMLRPAW